MCVFISQMQSVCSTYTKANHHIRSVIAINLEAFLYRYIMMLLQCGAAGVRWRVDTHNRNCIALRFLLLIQNGKGRRMEGTGGGTGCW